MEWRGRAGGASEKMAMREIAAGIGFGVICMGSCAGVSRALVALDEL